MGECWGEGTATFMILGNICTRSCGFCNVATGRPLDVDWDEPQRVAEAINLMKVKSKYYQDGVFPKLQADVEAALNVFPNFREELFDKLYSFFSRYFSESGSIYFTSTPLHQNIYEKVYTDDRDVMLFWKTHMLYYVKTDRLFKNLEVELDGFKFFFDVANLEHKKANEKREIVYEFKEKRKDGSLSFNVYYSEKGKKTKPDDILKELKNRRSYEKPSVKKKRKQREARRRRMKATRRFSSR